MCVFTVARITKSLLLMMMVTMMRIWKVSVVSKIVLGEVIFNILSTLLIEKKFFFFNRHHFFSGWHICTRTVIDLFVFSRLCLYLDLMDLNKMRIFTRTIQTSQIAFYGSFYTNTQQKHFFSFSFKQKPRYNSNKNTRVFSF